MYRTSLINCPSFSSFLSKLLHPPNFSIDQNWTVLESSTEIIPTITSRVITNSTSFGAPTKENGGLYSFTQSVYANSTTLPHTRPVPQPSTSCSTYCVLISNQIWAVWYTTIQWTEIQTRYTLFLFQLS
jgi:hypothetical protein